MARTKIKKDNRTKLYKELEKLQNNMRKRNYKIYEKGKAFTL